MYNVYSTFLCFCFMAITPFIFRIILEVTLEMCFISASSISHFHIFTYLQIFLFVY